jgi:O-acetyl-ADP-ribose deacetylase (regulator of RNase III)
MSEYPASHIRQLVGRDLTPIIKPHTPLAIGAAFVTDAGNMRARHLIHAPNTTAPGAQVQVEDVARAANAVIVACNVKGFDSVAVPLMGAFDTGIPAEETARAIHSEFKSNPSKAWASFGPPRPVLMLARVQRRWGIHLAPRRGLYAQPQPGPESRRLC